MQPLDRVLIWILYYALTLLLLRLAFSKARPPWRLILLLLVLVQFSLKIYSRFYLTSFSLRHSDEPHWLAEVSGFQRTGIIPLVDLAEGQGIYYAVALVGDLLHMNFPSALVVLAVLLGAIYVIPAFWMYKRLSGDELNFALAATILVSFSDAMIYSTTIARPELLGLFFLPLAIALLTIIRSGFRRGSFACLIVVSGIVLIVHTSITYLVLLLSLSFTLLLYDKLRRGEVAYTMIAFTIYGLMLRYFLPDLYRIWRVELFTAYPSNMIATLLGNNFFILFPALGVLVLALSRVICLVRLRASYASFVSKLQRLARPIDPVKIALILAALASIPIYLKYQGYINATYYGGIWGFLLLQSWKVPFIVLVLIGVREFLGAQSALTRSGKAAFGWIISLVVTVLFLTLYTPVQVFAGLGNLDERFAEFAYYPTFYFVTIALFKLKKTVEPKIFTWVVLPLVSLFVIPSVILGTQDPYFIRI